MTEQIKEQILLHTGSQFIIHTQRIQSLWSGYGEISRCQLEGGERAAVVVKHVQLPDQSQHPRGWNTDIGHQRKLKSYQVEMNWYASQTEAIDPHCRIPLGIYSWQQEGEMLMILEDLNEAGFSLRHHHIDLTQIKSCLSWLAYFHAKHLNHGGDGLWGIGTYWHMDTRPDEWQAMQNQALKKAAKAIDQRLNQAQFHTLVHGDAKLANFCFSKDTAEVAAVDFQYIGRGCGMKDVAYFISSCLDEEDCEALEDELLNHYFGQLSDACKHYNQKVDSDAVIAEWRALYPFAWADFYRFLDGWSPGHWKMHGYSEKLSRKAMNLLHI
ncbi:ecdysteroid 22-kinase family protein [Reichenbachiella ulvae]|uniref:Ecdysteroid 22-kinase family protein n=1 Tax=Reichenbachiella ulvae TaxID=2980104 RepID=A0ABT3CQL8_9BACT|nr:ecdysteroid 22-kinase family protein [Reichenbachiella ulvae]MCV9386005.1 ecdysteroid 22-kinase family protein [Reichenbachiella ulvae]